MAGVLGMREEIITRACTTAMKAQKSPEKAFVFDKSRSLSTVFFGFPGSRSPHDWLAPSNQNKTPFGGTSTTRDEFPSLRSVGNYENATVNEAFLKKFSSVRADSSFQDEVKKAVYERKHLVFTGHSSGGATAILMTVWFLENTLRRREAPVSVKCITFGSPLVGDNIFGHALRREKWDQHFVHFVMRYDVVPRIMLAPRSSIEADLSSILEFVDPRCSSSFRAMVAVASRSYFTLMKHASSVASYDACQLMGNTNPILQTVATFTELSPYRPFGTYMFCPRDNRFIQVTNPDAVLQILFYSLQLKHDSEAQDVACKSIDAHKQYERALQGNFQVIHLGRLDKIPLSLDSADLNVTETNTALEELSLSPRARLCIRAAGEAEKRKLQNQNKIEAKRSELTKELEWLNNYKSKCEAQRIGYYDQFKASPEEDDFRANVARVKLAGIWDEISEMLRKYELPDDFEIKQEWIELGTRYRCLVEPLDIANYYRHLKNEDTGPYMTKGRPRRYKFTQQWLDYNQQKLTGANAESCFRNEVKQLHPAYDMGPSEDIPEQLKGTGSMSNSCFWAEVEELRGLYRETPFDDIKLRVLVLERMLQKWMNEKEIGNEPFLQGSTFARWWHTLPEQHKQNSVLRQRLVTSN